MEIYTCAENAGVRTIGTMKDDLLALLDKGGGVTIDFAAVKRLDLSVVQVVIAAQKEAKKRRQTVRLAGLGADVKKQLFLCGVIKPAGAQEQ